jgi:hypothetical protein
VPACVERDVGDELVCTAIHGGTSVGESTLAGQPVPAKAIGEEPAVQPLARQPDLIVGAPEEANARRHLQAGEDQRACLAVETDRDD